MRKLRMRWARGRVKWMRFSFKSLMENATPGPISAMLSAKRYHKMNPTSNTMTTLKWA